MATLSAERSAPPIRLRTLLLLGLLGGAGYALYPRAQAAWSLHSSASNLADYALCMVGPTGPTLLRDNFPGFKSLVRRRLIAADANERPFQDCAKLSRELTASSEVESAHRATAWTFREYGGAATDRAASGAKHELSLEDLSVNPHALSDLARRAWPFERDGYVRLVKPSLTAREAMHPVELPKPAVGRGLPTWRSGYRSTGEVDGAITVAFGKAANLSVFSSRDGGLNFKPAPLRGVERFAERCAAGDRAFSFVLSGDSAALMVASAGPEAPPHASSLAKADSEILAAACDERAMVTLLRPEGKEAGLWVCGYRNNCRSMPLPRFAGIGPVPAANLDVARAAGVTIVSVPTHGIVRIATTRDDGQTWTPLVVAYDDAAHPDLRVEVRVPTRLLTIGKRVLLYGGAPKPGQTYSVLISDDFGASWRTP